MSHGLRVLAPEELGLVAGGSLDPSMDPNWLPAGSAYSGMALNVPVFSATTWTTSSFGNSDYGTNYNLYASDAYLNKPSSPYYNPNAPTYASANAFLMANPYSYEPEYTYGSSYLPKVSIVDNNNSDISSQSGSMANGVYKTTNPYSGLTEVVVKADVTAIVVTASFQADPSWTTFSNLAGLAGYSLQSDPMAMASLAACLAGLQNVSATLDKSSFEVDTTEAGTIDSAESNAIGNIKTAHTDLQTSLGQRADGAKITVPTAYNLPDITFGDLKAAAAKMDVKIVQDDGLNNGGVGSTQGTYQNPHFVLETNGPNGNGLTQYGQSTGLAKDYLAHELAHLTPAAQLFYNQQFTAWQSANSTLPASAFAGTSGWLATERFAWSVARDMTGGLSQTPAEGYLW